jgi:ABC-type antimicrobial peptide transport system permease subunit
MSLRSAIEREVQSVDGTISASRVRTMEQVISESLSRENFNTLLLSIFAAIAVLLAAIGIYGLMSYSVEQRTQEIGIRVALGAGRPEVLRLILVRGMILSGIGVVAGLAASFFITRLLASFLFGIKATDPATFAAVALTITVIAFLASWIPARRAAAVAPAVALRHQ